MLILKEVLGASGWLQEDPEAISQNHELIKPTTDLAGSNVA